MSQEVYLVNTRSYFYMIYNSVGKELSGQHLFQRHEDAVNWAKAYVSSFYNPGQVRIKEFSNFKELELYLENK